MLTLLVCFATGVPMTVQEKIAAAALFMAMVGGILFASVYRSGGDGPFPPTTTRAAPLTVPVATMRIRGGLSSSASSATTSASCLENGN